MREEGGDDLYSEGEDGPIVIYTRRGRGSPPSTLVAGTLIETSVEDPPVDLPVSPLTNGNVDRRPGQ